MSNFLEYCAGFFAVLVIFCTIIYAPAIFIIESIHLTKFIFG